MFSFGKSSAKELIPPEPTITPILEQDIAFVLGDSSFWLESLTFLVFSNDGAFTNITWAVASLPFSKHNTLLTIKHWHEGKEWTFQSKYDLTEDVQWQDELRTSAEMNDGSHVKYDHSSKTFSIKMVHKDADKPFEFVFTTTCGDGIKLGADGSYFYDTEKTLFWKFAWYPRCDVQASGLGRDLSGTGFVGRTITNVPLYNLSTRAAHLKLNTGTHTLTMLSITTPKAWGHAQIQVGAFIEGDKIVAVTTDNSVDVEQEAELDSFSGYSPPASYKFVWRGSTVDGEPFYAELPIVPQKLLACVDVLANLPAVVRWVVQKLIAKPFLYFWLEQVKAVVKVGDREMEIEGRALHEYHFINK
jgi:hypothetical protein